MKNLLESLKNLKEDDFFKNVNLHIHTNFSDGVLHPHQVIEKAENENFKIISITDHNSIEAYKYIENTGSLKIITGVEFDCWHKTNLLHILGYGFDVNNEKLKNLCAKNSEATRFDLVRFFNHRKAENTIEAIKEAGGIAILAHPLFYWNINLKKMIKELQSFGLDGIEMYYPYVGYKRIIKFHSVSSIKTIAAELNLLATGGTDCHGEDLKTR